MAKRFLALAACLASAACFFAINGDTERTASAASPLCRAVIQRDFNLLEAELSRRADPNAECGPFGNPLHWTMMRWDESSPRIMRRLLAAGAAPNQQSSHNWPPLMAAVASGQPEAVEILLDAGAAVNAGSEVFDSPLNVACYRHDVPMVELLLARGATITAAPGSGGTPLHASAGHPGLLRKFLARGADVNVRDRSGGTPLMRAALSYSGLNLPSAESVSVLLSAGADVHARDSSGRTALIHAVLAANRPAVETLINAGARTDERDNAGQSAVSLLEAKRAARPFSFHFWKLFDSGLRTFDRREIETIALLRSHGVR